MKGTLKEIMFMGLTKPNAVEYGDWTLGWCLWHI